MFNKKVNIDWFDNITYKDKKIGYVNGGHAHLLKKYEKSKWKLITKLPSVWYLTDLYELVFDLEEI